MRRLLTGLLCLSMVLGMAGCAGSASAGEDLALSAGSQNDQLWTYDDIGGGIQADTSLLSASSYSIRFWIRPEENFPGTAVFFAGTEDNYLALTASGYSNGGYSGMTLCRHRNNADEWLVADGGRTLQTSRYNYVVINSRGKNTEIWLNNEKIASGTLSGSLPGHFQFGSNPLSLRNEKGRYAGLILSGTVRSDQEIADEYNSRYASVLLDTIQFPQAQDQIDSLWLDDYEIEGTPVRWSVDPQDVMDAQGRIQRHDKDETVHLQAVIDTGGGAVTRKEFTLQIKSETEAECLARDEKALDADIPGVIFSGTVLPQTESKNTAVSWSVASGEAEIRDGALVKTGTAERMPVTLRADLQNGQAADSREYPVVLLDPVGGYIMSYFNGAAGIEAGRLAASGDGLHWTLLKGSEITSSLGTGRVRDPSISRAKDGSFLISATEGFDNPSVYLIQSEDLLDFSKQSLIQVAYPDAGMHMSGTRAWGPELIYDNEKDQYVLYFSDTAFENADHQAAGGIFAVTSSDLTTFSYPWILFDPGYPVIDGTIITMNGSYWMLYKDERKGALTIYDASASDLSTGFTRAYDDTVLHPQRYIEGPMAFPLADGSYCLYVDHYPKAEFFAGKILKLGEDPAITWYSASDYTLPEADVRNGSVIPVTAKEYERILAHYS